jgi:nucleoside-diphosphate-sugar epimerase
LARVLLTGASGFVGRHCRALLVEEGWEVHALSSREREGDDTHWHAADLLDSAELHATVRRIRPTHLLHLAWYTAPADLYRSLENLRWVRASLELLEAAAEVGVRRAVAAGSCAEYAWGGPERLSESGTPLEPATVYGRAKDALRRLLEAWTAGTGTSGAWARLFFLYGPGEHPDRLVPYVIRSLLREETAETSAGEQLRDYLYVGDAARALVRLLDSDVTGAINLASGTAIPVKELVLAAAEPLGGESLLRLGARPMRAEEPARIEADVDRQTRELGFRPEIDLETGMHRTIAWWRRELVRQSPPELPG